MEQVFEPFEVVSLFAEIILCYVFVLTRLKPKK